MDSKIICAVVDTTTNSYDEKSIETVWGACSAQRSAELLAAERAGIQWTESTLRFAVAADEASLTAFLRASGIDETKQLASKRSQAEIDDDHDAEDEERETLTKISAQCDDRAPFDGAKAARRLTKAVAAKAAKDTPSTKVDTESLRRNGLLANVLARKNGTG
jgi:hypothetical protein